MFNMRQLLMVPSTTPQQRYHTCTYTLLHPHCTMGPGVFSPEQVWTSLFLQLDWLHTKQFERLTCAAHPTLPFPYKWKGVLVLV